MKTTRTKQALIIATTLLLSAAMFASCSKNNNGPTKTPPPSNPGGYDSSNQIQSSALLVHFGFEGNFTDSKSGLVGVNNGASFTTGIKGQAYQGSGSSYVLVSSLGTVLNSLPSYTVSAWVKLPAEPVNNTTTAYIAGQGAQGVLFMYDNAAGSTWNLLHLDFEPYTPVSGDSVLVHAGFNSSGAPVYKGIVPAGFLDTALNKWTHVVMTYNGASSTYTLYQNGTTIQASTAWSMGYKPTPLQIWTDGTASTPMGNITFSTPPAGLVIGAFPQAVNPVLNASIGGAQPWSGNLQGALDELRIYNVALDATDVNSLYLLEKAGF